MALTSDDGSSQRCAGEGLHALVEGDGRRVAELSCSTVGAGEYVAYIALPERSRYDRPEFIARCRAEGFGERTGHFAHGSRLHGGHVVGTMRSIAPWLIVHPWLQECQHIGPSHVDDVNKVAALLSIFGDLRCAIGRQCGTEDTCYAAYGVSRGIRGP
jgi:hypothetical protein